MNAAFQPLEARFEPMTPDWLPAVLRVEQSAYPQPWSERNFLDSLQAGYQAQLLTAGSAEKPELLGYFVAMKGVDEVHLLNITVAPAWQRQGWALVMLDALGVWSRGQGALWLWLEVRVSNARARSVYESHGFRHVGTRRNYYPASAALPRGEDAIVMSLALSVF
ncbi:ribosomal protein S18-alanine N-acetyltransferase [Polaromonas naphthalenivorans]|uniref:[Ribosomal protein bS18]-alanine N-acetyltransferase n=1 Tax=Polaromonas naphthalenivorans (strain CJ2) TaxID=365044 RepID=A1VU13_POLNA|nr:ribosomal protein S18-alanine N-acetyltransferase [Polaromonas naphthalenivorans]ABM39141.1 [SSU ribosomal protein S18P]-alanine acetyltransferase [Polaromonas naphthalenivorans CJ2]